MWMTYLGLGPVVNYVEDNYLGPDVNYVEDTYLGPVVNYVEDNTYYLGRDVNYRKQAAIFDTYYCVLHALMQPE